MLVVERPQDLASHVGAETGVSDWLTVSQDMIQAFADATGDHQWIHVDVERARRELPGGRTIAHGYLLLSLVPQLASQVLQVRARSRGINYGSDRVRFITPVPNGSRVRLRHRIKAVEPAKDGMRVTAECTLELDGAERPCMVAETISILHG